MSLLAPASPTFSDGAGASGGSRGKAWLPAFAGSRFPWAAAGVLLPLSLGFTRGAAAAEPLPIGLDLLPCGSAFDLLSPHQSLCNHLWQSLGRPVQCYTGSRYAAFVKSRNAGDLPLTAPYMAPQLVQRIKIALREFAGESPKESMFRHAGVTGLDVVGQEEPKSMDPRARKPHALPEVRA